MLPRIWQPTLKDVTSALAPRRLVDRRAQNGVLAAQLDETTTLGLADDQVAHVTHIFAVGNAGAAQTVDFQFLFLEDEIGNVIGNIATAFPGVANFAQQLQTDFWVMPNEQIHLRQFFSAGVAGNGDTLSVMGVIYPRGNWQR